MAKAKNKAATSKAPELAAPQGEATDLAFEDAAKHAGIDVSEVFAAKEYEDRYQVVTVAGQKIVVEK